MHPSESRPVLILGALAQPSRLRIVSIVAEAGAGGIAAGEIARAMHCPASTLSFHLKELSRAGLMDARSRGRFVIYALQPAVLDELAKFVRRLGGAPKVPGKPRPAHARRSAPKGGTADRGQLSMFSD